MILHHFHPSSREQKLSSSIKCKNDFHQENSNGVENVTKTKYQKLLPKTQIKILLIYAILEWKPNHFHCSPQEHKYQISLCFSSFVKTYPFCYLGSKTFFRSHLEPPTSLSSYEAVGQ